MTASTSTTATGLTLKDKAAGLTQSNINGTGLAHAAGPLPDDSQCALCHKSNGTFPAAEIDLAHFPVTPPNPDNALAGRRQQLQHALRMDRIGRLGRPAAAGRHRADLRSEERLAQREQAAGDGVPLAAERHRRSDQPPSPPPPSTRRPD